MPVVHASNLGQCTCEQARNGDINQDREALVPGQREGTEGHKAGEWLVSSGETWHLVVSKHEHHHAVCWTINSGHIQLFLSVPASSQNSKQAARPAVILMSMKAS